MKSRLPAKLQGDLNAANCPSRTVLDHVTSRWGMLLLIVLQDGTRRFGELRKLIGGVSEKMLAQSLGTLEADGFVDRRAYAEVPPRVEYTLTPMGHELAAHLETLGRWVEDNVGRVVAARAKRERQPRSARDNREAREITAKRER
jgi:DNA-binding HxlR family transcriptional regulator